MGDLITKNVQLWAKGASSTNNFNNRGQNWGNYYVALMFVNLLPYQVSIHWINRCGIERERRSLLDSGRSTCIFAQLCHPHVVKRRGDPIYGIKDEYILGYNATARGLSNNGYHVIFIGGKIHPSMVQKKSLELIKKAPPDKRVPPVMGPAPSP
eukprot:372422_1